VIGHRLPRLSELEIVQRAEIRRELNADFRKQIIWSLYFVSLLVLMSLDWKAAAALAVFGALVYVYREVIT